MKLPWFKRNSIFFFPTSLIGWIVSLAGIVFAISVFIDIDRWSHSASDTLINFAVRLLFIWVVYSFIAFVASRKAKSE